MWWILNSSYIGNVLLNNSLSCPKDALKSMSSSLTTVMFGFFYFETEIKFNFFVKGYGGKRGAIEKCPVCKGRGMQVTVQQIGPGMVQQIQTVCPECKGQGERINPKDRCDNCHGCKVVREKKIIEVHVDKGKNCACVLCPY